MLLSLWLSACQTSSPSGPINKRCAVHGEQMFLGSPQVSTFPFWDSTTSEYKHAAKKRFPNVGKKLVIGCLQEHWPKRLPRVKYCEKCRAAAAEWLRSQQSHGEVPVRLRM